MNICPRCGHRNRPGALICGNCSTNVFDDKFGSTRLMESLKMAPEYAERPANSDLRVMNSAIDLRVMGGTVIRVQLEEEMILGRINKQSPMRPDVDLTACYAFERGVSTRHARLACDEDRLQIADLGSTNGTFINGERLVPHRPYYLNFGDELRLGRLVMHVNLVDEADSLEAR